MMTISHYRRISAANKYGFEIVLTLAFSLSSIILAAQLAQAQTFTTLHEFTQAPDGEAPQGDLYIDPSGNLYGTTPSGGSGNGIIFKVTPAGVESIVHTFGGSDGSAPKAGLIHFGSSFYGTTYSGGASNNGTVFRLTGSLLTVLHSFSGTDGAHPTAALIRDSAGNLYGTTYYGGTASCSCGTIFKIDPTGAETVLYSFTGGTDGKFPAGHLVRDTAGNLYGTASEGGNVSCNNNTVGCGTVFQLGTTGVLGVLYSFTGGTDGGGPLAGLVRDGAGNLYGTTSLAGVTNSSCSFNHGCGTVFKIGRTGGFTLLYGFTGADDGFRPVADLLRDSAGNLYGATQYGGVGYGVVFEISPTFGFFTLHGFVDSSDGGDPLGGLVLDSAGNLYGTASIGGDLDFEEGVVFELTP